MPHGGAVVGDDGDHGGTAGVQVRGADVGGDRRTVQGPDVEEVAEERVRARGDHLLRQAGRLGHQEQVEAHRGRRAVHDLPHVQGRQDVQAGQVGDRVGMVQARAERDQGAPVVPGERETFVSQGPGQGDDVGGHRAFRVRRLIVGGRLVARPVPAQVGADHRVVRGEVRRDVPPHQVGLREAVQQHDRAAGAADGGVQGHAVGDGDAAVVEAGDGRRHGAVLSVRWRNENTRQPAGRE